MRGLLAVLTGGLILSAAVGPDEVRVSYSQYAPPGLAGFRAETRVVEASAVVRDSHYKIIDLLGQSDFRILDDGKEQRITSFAVQRSGGSVAGGAFGSVAERTPPRLIALVIDDVAYMLFCGTVRPMPNVAAISGIARVKDAAAKFVQTNLRPEDRISIIGFSSGQTVSFTNDVNQLLEGIRKVSIDQPCRPLDKMSMIGDVIDAMAKQRGNRSVVLASWGFFSSTESREEIAAKAVRAQIPIHTLNTHGFALNALNAEGLNYLADHTGGRMFRNSNSYEIGLADLLSPPAVSYVIGFIPDAARDGRYHALKIQLRGRKGGYSVEARPGYYAPDERDERAHAEQSIDGAIDRAVMAQDARGEVPVSLTALPDRLVTGEPAVSVVAHVDISRLPFRSLFERRLQNLRVIVALFDGGGNFVAGKEGDVEFFLKDSSFAEISKDGVNATLTLPAPAGSYRVRMVVADQSSKLTAVSAQVRIP